jgi:hypothetical protein
MTKIYEGSLYKRFVSRELSTESKIKGFLKLDDGWNYGFGARFSEGQVNRALSIHRFFIQLGISTTDAFPGMAGEISVTGYKDEYYLEYTIINPTTSSFVARKNNVIISQSFRIEMGAALKEMVDVVGEIWNTYGSLTHNTITIGDAVGSIDQHLAPERTEAFPLLVAVA